MAYSKIFYHINWCTKYRKSLIIPTIEDRLHNHIAKKSRDPGAYLYQVGGVADHVHIALSISPKIAIAQFVGQVKADSSLRINLSNLIDYHFRWQSGYAIFTFRESELPNIINYIRNQKHHHSKGSLKSPLEVFDHDK